MEIKNHTDLLIALSNKYNLQKYLEIGIRRGVNFKSVPCRHKVGVDPDPTANATHVMTSDEFFECNKDTFDLIFIDGLHHADQVKKDFDNALKCLSDRGFILLHDTNPEAEKFTHVPQDNKVWNGDVYKFACKLREYQGIKFITFDMDYGCTLVWRDSTAKASKVQEDITWEYFVRNRERSLTLVSPKNSLDNLIG